MATLTSTNSLPLRRKRPPARPLSKPVPSKLSGPTPAEPALPAFKFILATLFLTASLPLRAWSASTAVPLVQADLILKNARVYTDPLAGPTEGRSHAAFWSEALSVREGNILSIGSNKAIDRERGPETRVIDLKGRVVLPAFNDAHVHFINGGLALTRVELGGARSISQVQEALKDYAAANPLKRWIFGQGWDQALFSEKRLPTREDLDKAVSDRPVFLWHSEHRMAVLNSKALEALKITSSTSGPSSARGGEIRKNDHGEPTGILTEEIAFEAEQKVDNPGLDELKQAFQAAQAAASKAGVASIQGGPIHGEDEIKVIDQLWIEKKLRVRYAMWGDLERPQEFVALKEKYRHLPDDWVRFEAVKGYVDGVLGARSAALDDPYADDPHNRGEPFYTQERLTELVLNANRLGLPVALHATGDRAVAMAVNAFVAAKRQLFNSTIHNRVEHIEVAPPYVYSKFADFRIVASMQPSHMLYDNEAQSYIDARLGPERIKDAFPLKSLLAAGAHLAFGTDWPVESLNPMRGLFAAVYRQHLDGKPSNGWQPQQKITLEQAIDAYTLGSAYATREEHVKGSLREGKYADIVVLEKDPFKLKGTELLKDGVYLTIVGGKIVYDGTVPELRAK